MKLVPPVREPMISSKLPNLPWERIATDLFKLDKQTYLLIVDYCLKVNKLILTTSPNVITAMKLIFSRHGIPQTVNSDNGPQYDSQSNNLAECLVKIIKNFLREAPLP